MSLRTRPAGPAKFEEGDVLFELTQSIHALRTTENLPISGVAVQEMDMAGLEITLEKK